MTDNIINLTERLAVKRALQGNEMFMLCPCQETAEEPSGFHPVVIHDAQGFIVSALVCANCGEFAHVDGGRISDD